MSAKPLNGVDRSKMIVTGSQTKPSGGRMAKRHVRSVHREACRPQGIRSPQRQFSPVRISLTAGDDGFSVHGSQHRTGRYGKTGAGLPGFEAVACMERSEFELGRAHGFPQGYVHPTNGRMRK